MYVHKIESAYFAVLVFALMSESQPSWEEALTNTTKPLARDAGTVWRRPSSPVTVGAGGRSEGPGGAFLHLEGPRSAPNSAFVLHARLPDDHSEQCFIRE